MSDDEYPEISRGMSATAMPPLPQPDADAVALVAAMLDQRAIDPDLQARFFDPDAVAARQARDARRRTDDWPALSRYRAANADAAPPELVMIGDSLTEIWGLAMPGMFGSGIVNRGISGQTSPQILLRFMADVVDLKPRRVHILCGTNDIAGNTGPTVPEDYQRNIRAMADIAGANGIAVLLGAIPPARTIFWQTDSQPREWIPYLNGWLRDFAAERGLGFVDYHAALTDGDGALQPQFSADGVHVTRAAYRLMRELLDRALETTA